MAALTSASFGLIVCFLICSSEAQTNLTAKTISADLGKNVILPCEVHNINIRAVEWKRPDLDPDHVLVYRNGRIDPENQHPSYQNRVDLQDRKMEDGDVSLILKNVTKNDNGIYKCLVAQGGKNRTKRSDSEPKSIINLEVVEPGNKVGNTGDGGDKTGIIVGSVVGGILLAVAPVGFLIYKRSIGRRRKFFI